MKQTVLGLCLALILSFLLSVSCLASSTYQLSIQNGYLAVWDCQSQSWSEVTGTPVSSLPEADRKLLEYGITCSEQELQLLLEDYCS